VGDDTHGKADSDNGFREPAGHAVEFDEYSRRLDVEYERAAVLQAADRVARERRSRLVVLEGGRC
jgi:hypothetical protein